MKPLAIIAIMIMTLAACQPSSESDSKQQLGKNQTTTSSHAFTEAKPPVAKKIPHELTIHGDTRIDNYYWLRDDERKDPEVLAYLEAENAYADSVLAHTTALQNKIYQELVGRIKKDDSSVPAKYKDYFYYVRFEGEKEYPIYARKKGKLTAPEEIMLDGNAMAEGTDYFAIGSTAISPNQNLLAYSTDTVSRRIYTIEFKDLTTGKPLKDRLQQTTGQVIWANDNQTVFYIKKDLQTLLGDKVYRHRLGTPQNEDQLVYEETDKSFYTSLGKTKDDSVIYIYHSSTTTSGASLIDANQPTEQFTPFLPLEDNHEYSFEKAGDWYYILTNWNAKNFRIMRTKANHTQDKSTWEEVVAHNPKVFLEDLEVLENYLVISEKERGQSRIRALDLRNNQSQELLFDDPIFVAGFTGNNEIKTNTIRLYYSSLTTPMTTYDYDLSTGQRTLLKQEEVLGGFHPQNYQSERIFVTARDGQEIPVSIVYRKDKFKKDGTNPLYQYGYGSYGYTIDPFFSSSRLSLLDRGFVYAIAHVRGGQMLGREWYEEGKLFNKKNTFNDFIDVTRALVAMKYAAKDKVFAAGGSAGGLLMGAVVNMAPELYKGVAAHVPFVDVVTTMLDESIPLTTNEYDEWGNPNNKDAYQYMLSYSPYDQVKPQAYPNLLVTTGLHDSQVQYFEPAKWVAKLRDMKTDHNLLVFKTNMDAGHGGASGRFRRNKERALEYAFFCDLAGIKE
jgi:oligopeptidase B